MNLGEAMLRVIRFEADLLPRRRDRLLELFLEGLALPGDGPDAELLRASSLSQLGELCKVLHYELGAYTWRVLASVRDVLRVRSASAELRRAAAVLLGLVFDAGDVDLTRLAEGGVLKELHAILRITAAADSDEVVRRHAEHALALLDERVRQSLLPGDFAVLSGSQRRTFT